jgi:hypothetical protein
VPALLGVTAVALVAAVAWAGEIQRMEAVGAVPLGTDAPRRSPPRDAALQVALSDAVRRVALDLLPDLDPAEAETVLDEVLGGDPGEYVSAYRILEDRGERPALFVEDPSVETEYVVVVEVNVDAGRIRERLTAGGLLALPVGETRGFRLRLVIEELDGFPAYALLRHTLVEGVGVRSALPVEMERGRAVLELEADLRPSELLDALLAAAPPELQIVPLAAEGDSLTLRVRRVELPVAPAAEPGGGGADPDPRAPGAPAD